MSEPLFPVALAAKLRQSVNFDNLAEWAEIIIARKRVELEGHLEEYYTANIRGQIATLKSLRSLGKKCDEILQQASK